MKRLECVKFHENEQIEETGVNSLSHSRECPGSNSSGYDFHSMGIRLSYLVSSRTQLREVVGSTHRLGYDT